MVRLMHLRMAKLAEPQNSCGNMNKIDINDPSIIFHSLYMTFDSDAIKTLDVYSGG